MTQIAPSGNGENGTKFLVLLLECVKFSLLKLNQDGFNRAQEIYRHALPSLIESAEEHRDHLENSVEVQSAYSNTHTDVSFDISDEESVSGSDISSKSDASSVSSKAPRNYQCMCSPEIDCQFQEGDPIGDQHRCINKPACESRFSAFCLKGDAEMSGMKCRLCLDVQNPLDVSAVTTESDKLFDASKKSKASYDENVPSKFPMMKRETSLTNKRTFLNRLEDKNGVVIFSGEFVDVTSRPKGRYLLMGVITEHGKKNPKNLVYDVHEDFCSKVYYSWLASSRTFTPSKDQIEKMEKALSVVLSKTNNSKDVVGLKLMSKKVQLGEQLSTTENDTLPLADKVSMY